MIGNVIPAQRPAHQDVGPTRVVYTVPEVAGLLGVSRGIAYALVRDGTIPAQRLGHRWVVPCGRFHAWLDASQDGAL